MSGSQIRSVFTGQSLIEEPLQPFDCEAAQQLHSWIGKGDVRFTNLEVNINKSEGWPMGYYSTDKSLDWPEHRMSMHAPGPEVLDELETFEFNLYSLANNHAWDTGIDGIFDTIDEFERRSLVYAGIGRNLTQARQPAYVETQNGTVALIAMASGHLPPQAYALDSADGGRPGVNPLKVRTSIEVPKQQFSGLVELAESFNRKADSDHRPRFVNGAYGTVSSDTQGSRVLDFLGKRFIQGDEFGLVRHIHEDDRTKHLELIRKANEKADLVVVYFHHHHWEMNPLQVGPWMREFTRECIDEGAHAFLGAGVPMLKPMELYKGMPIFYSLGNFIFQPNGYWPSPWVWQSAVVDGTFKNNRWSELTVKPITLVHPDRLSLDDPSPEQHNCPVAASTEQANAILQHLEELSAPFGTDLEIRGKTARI